MTAGHRLRITAEPSAGLLCRLVGLAAQRDLPAPAMRVTVMPEAMVVELDLAGLDPHHARIIAEKAVRCVGVWAVALDGIPLDDLAAIEVELAFAGTALPQNAKPTVAPIVRGRIDDARTSGMSLPPIAAGTANG